MRLGFVLGVTGLLCAPTALAQNGTDTKYRGTPKDHAVTLTIDPPAATIMEDGLFVGHSGDRLDSRPGLHTYQISAPGYVPRMVYTNQPKSALNLARSVTLVPVPTKGYDVELDYAQAKAFPATRKLETLASLCAEATAAGVNFPSNLALTCGRQTIIDDLRLLGGDVLFPPALVAGADPATAKLIGRLDHATDEDFYWSAEELFTAKAASPLAASLLAYSAMRRQNCPRVMEIAIETGAARLSNSGLTAIRGLCLELAGKADKAVAIYQGLVKGGDKPTVDAYYFVARAQHGVNADAASKTLDACIAAYPSAYHCYEAQAQIRALSRQPAAALASLQAYQKAAIPSIRAALRGGVAHFDARILAREAQLRPYNFEFAAAAQAIGSGNPQAFAPATLVSDPGSLRSLLPQLEKSAPKDVVITAYQAVAKAYPRDVQYWLRLAALETRYSRCEDALAATAKALALISDANRRAAITVSKATCLVQLARFAEAKKDLTSVLAAGHDSWQAHYNLGIVNERLGTVDDAEREYNLALQGDVPPAIRAQIEQRLDFASGGQKNAKDAPAH